MRSGKERLEAVWENNWWVQASGKQRLIMAALGAVILATFMAGCLGSDPPTNSIVVTDWANNAPGTLRAHMGVGSNPYGASWFDTVNWTMEGESKDSDPGLFARCRPTEGGSTLAQVEVFREDGRMADSETNTYIPCGKNTTAEMSVVVDSRYQLHLDVKYPSESES